MQKAKETVVLAFSGGLDTTFCALYLKEQGYDVITATINTGGFSEEELKKIAEKSQLLGSKKHYTIDVKEKIYDSIIQYIIKLNGLYEDEYPLMCADRYIIAEEILRIAKEEGSQLVAHGSTAVGNDQVRFDASFPTLNPSVTVLAPIKTLGIKREEEIRYLEERGFPVEQTLKKYSVNENIFGVTVSGTEIDENLEPDETAYKLTKSQGTLASIYVTLDFQNGVPVKLNGEALPGIEILSRLNHCLGPYGYGNNIYIGDCIIGIKGRILFEAPGLLALVEANKKLSQLTLTKKQLLFNKMAAANWSDLVYNGLYYEPLVKDIEAYIDSVSQRVNGTVKLKVAANKIAVVALHSPNSMVNKDIAIYAQQSSWSAQEANGFIKLHSMQQRLAGGK